MVRALAAGTNEVSLATPREVIQAQESKNIDLQKCPHNHRPSKTINSNAN
jgi:DNA repair protein RadC